MSTDKQTAELDRVVTLVESHLKEEGLTPDDVKMKTADGHPAWAFRQGSASVRIHLLAGDKDSDYGYFQVVAPVIIWVSTSNLIPVIPTGSFIPSCESTM